MASSWSSWSRVAAGLQLVAREAAKLAAREAGTVSVKSAQHGAEILSSASQAATAAATAAVSSATSFHQYQQQGAASTTHYGHQTNENTPPWSTTTSTASTGTNTIPTEHHTAITTAAMALHPTPQTAGTIASTTTLVDQQSSVSQQPRTNGPTRAFDAINTISSTDSTTTTAWEGVVGNPDHVEEGAASAGFVVSQQLLQQQQPQATPLEQQEQQHQHVLLKEGKPVPSTRLGRAAGFAELGIGLAWGTAVEGFSRLIGSNTSSTSSSMIVNDANSDRLAMSLCRMRGAALKLGQMLSIQDETLLPPPLTRALKQVRQGAEAMPQRQLHQQLEAQLGKDWRSRFVSFEERPFAAASIGQVHRAQILIPTTNSSSQETNNKLLKDVVVKVQYPGVGRSIESDLRNLSMLVTWTGLAPKGLFLDNVIRVGQQELQVECDYKREALNQRRLRQLVAADPILSQQNRFVVPDVMDEWSTDEILTSEYRPGGTIDKVSHLDQEERNRIARTIMYLTMKELFVWRFMQTDPNWGNFLYDVGTRSTSLIDFGAAREYSKTFVDGYLRIVWASANRDQDALLKQSYRMNFLTGQENAQMVQAHTLSGYTVGEPFFRSDGKPFDFQGSNISTRMGEHTSVFLQHRLTPPPEEVYTLHRKLAGAYMLCIKLGAVIHCRDLLEDIVSNYKFDDGLEPLNA